MSETINIEQAVLEDVWKVSFGTKIALRSP
jgi:hypothetical protein